MDTEPPKAATLAVPPSDPAESIADAKPQKLISEGVGSTPGRTIYSGRSRSWRRFRRDLRTLTEILRDLGKWFAISLTLVLFAVVTYRVFHDHSVQIGTIVVPKDLENRGYTSRAVDERLSYEIDQIVRSTQTLASKEQFAVAGDSDMPDIEMTKGDLSFRSVVLFLQDAVGLQPPLVTGEITQDKVGDDLTATVSISHSGRDRSAPLFEPIASHNDPESLVREMAEKTVELIDPYILASRAYDEHNRKKTMYFISKCDGKFAKWGWVLWGLTLEDEKNFDEAIKKYEKATEIDPKFALAYNNWGNVLSEKPNPNYNEAIEKYTTATEIDPKFALAYYNWGNALEFKPEPDYDGAIAKYEKGAEYNKATEIDPKYAGLYNNWGYALILIPEPDYDGAIEKYKKAIEIDPKHTLAYADWGSALINKPNPDYDGAIEECERAIKISPTDSYANSELSEAISKDDHPHDAVAKFKKLVIAQPNDWTSHYILGVLGRCPEGC